MATKLPARPSCEVCEEYLKEEYHVLCHQIQSGPTHAPTVKESYNVLQCCSETCYNAYLGGTNEENDLEQVFDKLEQDIQTVIEGTKHDSREQTIALIFPWLSAEDREALVARMKRAIIERQEK